MEAKHLQSFFLNHHQPNMLEILVTKSRQSAIQSSHRIQKRK